MQKCKTFSSIPSFCLLKEKRFNYGVLVGSLLMAFGISIVIKSLFYTQLSILDIQSQSSMDAGNQFTMFKDTSPLHKLVEERTHVEPVCNGCDCEPISNYCEIDEDVAVQGNSSSVSMVSGIPGGKISWRVKPYVRKESALAMDRVKSWSVTSTESPICDVIRSVPAILFSVGGFSGNHFHDFSDIVIPLYITSRQFNGEVQFLVTDNKPWWIGKFERVLKKLSRYDVIDIDREEGKTHCYPKIIVGLKYHHELGIDQSESKDQLSMKDFRQFLRRTYSLKKVKAIKIRDDTGKRPRLLIISRRKSRSFTNIDEITQTAIGLGYDVVTTEPNTSTSLGNVAQTVNSCDVLMGIHGAGLTNMVFLPDNAIVIQIVPFGSIDGLARVYFEEPSKDMKLRYLGYKIKARESSLMSNHKVDDVIIKDPLSVHKHGWHAVWSTYLNKQNVKLDVNRFRSTLLKALELLHHDDH